MNYLSNEIIENKNVILRCDLNVTIKDNKILDDSKIIKSLDTIKYLLKNDNRVIILSHLGRVKTEEDKKNNSLYLVYKELQKYFDIEFIPNPLNLEEVTDVSTKKCFLVENTRFTDVPKKRESSNDLELAQYWASFGDIFVLDAFGSMHRAHSSTAGISEYLNTYLGLLVEKELDNLKVLTNNTPHPFVVIMGGAKVDDKTKLIGNLLERCDKLILTGGILNTFLKVSGKNIGNSLSSTDEEVLKYVKDITNKYQNKLLFSNSFVVKRNDEILIVKLEDIKDEDIIYDNIPNISSIVNNSKLVFLNGTCGKYEEEEYKIGTIKMLNELSKCNACVIAGGGDTLSSIRKFGYENKFDFLSSGGGATLEYIADGKLEALEWIKKSKTLKLEHISTNVYND